MYVLKNKFYIIIVFAFDFIGAIITAPFRIFKGRMPKDIKKILVIRLDHIGDLLFATPAFRAIKERYPNAKLDILIAKQNKDIVKSNPFVNGVMVYNAPWFRRRTRRVINLAEYIRLAKVLRKERYDIGIDLRGDIRHIVLMLLADIRYKVGYGITGGGFLLDKEVGFQPYAHEAEHNLNLLKAIGIRCRYRENEFFILDEHKDFVEKFCLQNELTAEDFIVCAHPGSGYLSKRWLPKKWAQLLDGIIEEFHAAVIMVGSKEDKTLTTSITKMVKGKVIDATDKTSLGALAALLKKVRLFVGTDSGPSHIASAVGTPSVILYSGTNNAKQWAPLGERIIVIQKDIPCKGCEKLKCANNICMDLITVDEVLRAARQLI